MKEKSPISRLIAWLDDNLLALLAGFLIVFIPLYPKIPAIDVLPGYVVRIRFEDFAILFTFVVWLIQLARKKVTWHPTITKLILLYLLFGFLSTLSAMFITKTVPLEPIHIGKMYLHYLRRIEYFALFFIFYSAIRTKAQARKIIIALILVMIAVAVYGYGQKYLYWPVFSTMNREFAKGWRLYLTEHARVPSTFGGHYDAAAFTMIVATIMLAIFFYAKKAWVKILSAIAFFAGLWLLILTASRTSFIGYLVAVTILFVLISFQRSWKFAIPRWAGVMAISLFIMLSFGDLSDRYSQLLGVDRFSEKYAFLFTAKIDKPDDYVNLTETDLVSSPSDQPPVTEKPTDLPGDVYEDIPVKKMFIDEEGNVEYRDVPRTYSENAHKYGLSAAIRLDALWPRAWAGFMANPLLGAGYSTLTKESVEVFTEAESTDNDYLRALGETGVLGAVTFFGTVIVIMVLAYKSLGKLTDPLFIAFTLGFIAASVGLLLNAAYIDIFEASKVAEIYWALAGLVIVLPFIGTGQKEAKATTKAKTGSKSKPKKKSK